MVMIQRQTSCPPSYYCYSGSQLPMGNDENMLPSYDFGNSRSYSGHRGNPRKSFLNSKKHMAFPKKWILPAAYLTVLISWLGAFRVNGRLAQIYIDLEAEMQALGLQRDESKRFLADAKKTSKELKQEQKKLKRTHRLLQHEIRMKEEVDEMDPSDEESEDVVNAVRSRQSGVAMTWIQQRQEALYSKIYHLQDFIQEESRKQALEKYGPGPHRVQFTIQPHNTTERDNFVVELAPLDLVPHSIEIFLDMVTNRLWDNTVFYHHAAQNHVIAAAPVNYGTFDTKHYHFSALGYTGVSYPEYSPLFPHEEFTIGFSGKGPNFYINTMDNRRHHGPGGQGHHGLPSDADPCFGKIVSGKSAITKMMPGKHSSGRDPISWHDFDLTQIVRLELL